MTLNEYLGINSCNMREDGTEMTHKEKYEAIVNAIGYEELKKCLPSNTELLLSEELLKKESKCIRELEL